MADSSLLGRRACRKCGARERYANGQCIPCAKAYGATYRAAHRESARAREARYREANAEKRRLAAVDYRARNAEKVLASDRQRRAANKEQLRARAAARYAKFPDRVKAINAAWAAANPEAVRVNDQNRKARKRNAGGTLSADIVHKLLSLQRGKCACCNLPLGDDYQIDHITPLARGGTNSDDNAQLLHGKCNRRKHAKHPVTFMQELGFLI